MRIAKIIGTVTLNRSHPSLQGGVLKLATALTLDNLTGKSDEAADPLVVYDELGAGVGSRIALSESREAAAPFYPEMKPVDAYNAAIIDELTVEDL